MDSREQLACLFTGLSAAADISALWSARRYPVSRTLFWSLVASGLWHASTAVGHGLLAAQYARQRGAARSRILDLNTVSGEANQLKITLDSTSTIPWEMSVGTPKTVWITVGLQEKWEISDSKNESDLINELNEDLKKESDNEKIKEIKDVIVDAQKAKRGLANRLAELKAVFAPAGLATWYNFMTNVEQKFNIEIAELKRLTNLLINEIDTAWHNDDASNLENFRQRLQIIKNRRQQLVNTVQQAKQDVEHKKQQVDVILKQPLSDFDY